MFRIWQCRSSSEGENSKAKFVDRYHVCKNVTLDNPRMVQGKQDFNYQKEVSILCPTSHVKSLDQFNTVETPQHSSLTIKVVREKGRRRKRRATGAGLAAQLEVSSSQSGNSTPSSPLSSNASTPKQAWSVSPRSDIPYTGLSLEQRHYKMHDSEITIPGRVLESDKQCKMVGTVPSQRQSPANLNSLRHPATPIVNFPEYGFNCHHIGSSSILAPCSPIAPPARAPGPKNSMDKSMKVEESHGVIKEHTYDIWGNNFSDNFLVRRKELGMSADALEGDSQSFFAILSP